MLPSLYSGISGMQQFQQSMNVIGNNIANVNTTGFKSARTNFSDTFSEVLGRTGSGGSVQIGMGVATSSITNQFSQGSLSDTGISTDLAIQGDGFFVVRDSITNSEYLTRAGDFQVDLNGYLVTTAGFRVQGYSDTSLSTVGDLQIDGTGSGASAGATMASFTIDAQGKVQVRMSDGTEFTRGQILLQSVRTPQALVREGNNLYSGAETAGPLAAAVVPGTSGVGSLAVGTLEMSNVDLANEFTSLITTQRAFQANARMITTSDEMLQELVNLKR